MTTENRNRQKLQHDRQKK